MLAPPLHVFPMIFQKDSATLDAQIYHDRLTLSYPVKGPSSRINPDRPMNHTDEYFFNDFLGVMIDNTAQTFVIHTSEFKKGCCSGPNPLFRTIIKVQYKFQTADDERVS
jgi:hypothetical protein